MSCPNCKCCPRCHGEFEENDPIHSPHLCELCKNGVCINCMYYTCYICHQAFICGSCKYLYQKQFEDPYDETKMKCTKHQKETIVKCAGINCLCKYKY